MDRHLPEKQFTDQTIDHANTAFTFDWLSERMAARVMREGELVVRGAVGGAIKEPEKDPGATATKAAAAVGTGALLGIAATAASPWIAGTAVALGVAGTGAWLWGTFNTADRANRERNAVIDKAIRQTWATDDRRTFERSLNAFQASAGKDSLDLGLGLLSGIGAAGAGRYVPGMVCRALPSVGFKSFSQHAIERAFPARIREFEVMGEAPNLVPLKDGDAVHLRVREIFRTDNGRAQPNRTEFNLLISHSECHGIDIVARTSDLIATCHPELLEPLARVKSILQSAQNVELQVDAAARRLRFLTLDKRQAHSVADAFPVAERFVLGENATRGLPFLDFMHQLRAGTALYNALPLHVQDALRYHNLTEFQRVFSSLPYNVLRVIGAGQESVALRLSDTNEAEIFKTENTQPSDVVLKISNPKYGLIDESHGMRAFDARRIGDFTRGRQSEYVAYLQEKVQPITDLNDVSDDEWEHLHYLFKRHDVSFYDKAGRGQLGRRPDGSVVVIDWFALLPEWLCDRPEALRNDFRPNR